MALSVAFDSTDHPFLEILSSIGFLDAVVN